MARGWGYGMRRSWRGGGNGTGIVLYPRAGRRLPRIYAGKPAMTG